MSYLVLSTGVPYPTFFTETNTLQSARNSTSKEVLLDTAGVDTGPSLGMLTVGKNTVAFFYQEEH